MTNMNRQVKDKSIWFVISIKWIEAYQKYIYFDYLLGNPQDIKQEERVNPGIINNEDIIQTLPKCQYLIEMSIRDKWQNIVLKPGLKEGTDFLLVDEFLWDFLKKRYSCKD